MKVYLKVSCLPFAVGKQRSIHDFMENRKIFHFRSRNQSTNYIPVWLHRCFIKFLRRSSTSASAGSERPIWSRRRPQCNVLAHRRLRQLHAGKIDRRFFVRVTETFGRSHRPAIFGCLFLERRWTVASSLSLRPLLVWRVARERCIRHLLFGIGLISRLFVNLLDSLRVVVITTWHPFALFKKELIKFLKIFGIKSGTGFASHRHQLAIVFI